MITKFKWDGQFDTYRRMLPITNVLHAFNKGRLRLLYRDDREVTVKKGQELVRSSGGFVALLSLKQKS